MEATSGGDCADKYFQVEFFSPSEHLKSADSFSPFPRPQEALLPLPSAASPSPAGGGGGASAGGVRRAGPDVDLSLLDLAAGLRGKVLDLLLRLQVEHDVPQLLLQLRDGPVLVLPCRSPADTHEEEEEAVRHHEEHLSVKTL